MEIVDLRKELPCHPRKKYKIRNIKQIRKVVIHHSLTEGGDAFSFARYHIQTRDWPGIGYHYVICTDGKIQWCNDWETVSYHVGNSNDQTLGICLVGDFRQGKQPTEAQWNSFFWLCRYLFKLLPWLESKDVQGHNELPSYSWKQCPMIDMERVRKRLYEWNILIPVDVEVNEVLLKGFLKTDEGRAYVQVKQLAEALKADLRYQEESRNVKLDIMPSNNQHIAIDSLKKENQQLKEKLRKIKQIVSEFEL